MNLLRLIGCYHYDDFALAKGLGVRFIRCFPELENPLAEGAGWRGGARNADFFVVDAVAKRNFILGWRSTKAKVYPR